MSIWHGALTNRVFDQLATDLQYGLGIANPPPMIGCWQCDKMGLGNVLGQLATSLEPHTTDATAMVDHRWSANPGEKETNISIPDPPDPPLSAAVGPARDGAHYS